MFSLEYLKVSVFLFWNFQWGTEERMLFYNYNQKQQFASSKERSKSDFQLYWKKKIVALAFLWFFRDFSEKRYGKNTSKWLLF